MTWLIAFDLAIPVTCHLSSTFSCHPYSLCRNSIDSKKAMKAWEQKRRKWYSGSSQKQHQNRKDRSSDFPDLTKTIDSEAALKFLTDAGYVSKPHACSKCGSGGLHGVFRRPGYEENGQLYYRCDVHSCRAYTNVLSGCAWMKQMQRFRNVTPARLYLAIQCYTTKQNPRRQDAVSLGVPAKAAQAIFDALRHLEVKESEKQTSSLRLRGQAGWEEIPVQIKAIWLDSMRWW